MKHKKVCHVALVLRNLTEVNDALHEIGELNRSIKAVESGLEEKIAALRQEADREIAPLVSDFGRRTQGLETYAEANREMLLPDGKKTVVLSAGNFGWRMTPPKVSAGRGGDAKVLKKVKELKLNLYIRIKEELDKEALLRDKPVIAGVKYTQKEEFFIESSSVSAPDIYPAIVARNS